MLLRCTKTYKLCFRLSQQKTIITSSSIILNIGTTVLANFFRTREVSSYVLDMLRSNQDIASVSALLDIEDSNFNDQIL